MNKGADCIVVLRAGLPTVNLRDSTWTPGDKRENQVIDVKENIKDFYVGKRKIIVVLK